jgi:membrane glycosyltransferase
MELSVATPALNPERESQRDDVSEPSSQLRLRVPQRSRAERRVAEYLRALGLSDETRVHALSEQLAAQVEGDHPEPAVAVAQERVAQYWRELFGDEAETTCPLWLRAFVGANPEHFLGEPDLARAAADRFGDRRAGTPPAEAHFSDQQLERIQLPGWLRGLVVPVMATVAVVSVVIGQLERDGLSVAEAAWTALFAGLFLQAAIGTWIAIRGFRAGASTGAGASASTGALPRSALLMPIYHEDAEHVFAALLAMRESLLRTPGGDSFELFVLSDSQDPGHAAEEERAFRRAAAIAGKQVPIYYRRRARNERKKAGNLAEFFERFGTRYRYAAVLDADSLMRGESLVALVQRMEAEPRLALLQAPLGLHGGQSVFARSQQVAASTAGPLLLRGLAAWSGPHGNYYGHNAIVRVSAFLECCALPVLAGEPPLGGQLLSHDFVEAALLCRAGHEVRTAEELGGSWEEMPQSLPAYVARDRRWCQGNVQHLRVAFTAGLRGMSRVHLFMGAAAYLAGPAWLAFVVLGALLARPQLNATPLSTPLSLALSASAAGLLLLPRILGLVATLRDRARLPAYGGALALTASALFELALSAWLAPLFMLHHTRCVLSILLGHSVSWGAQRRSADSPWLQIVWSELPATALGAFMLVALRYGAPALLPWLAPVWLPLLLAIPLAQLASSAAVGTWLARRGLLLVPSETEPDELVLRAAELRALTRADGAARFRDLVLDPVLLAAHLQRLERASGTTADDDSLARLRERALRVGPAGLSADERDVLSAHAPSMRALHRDAWRRWPVESWQLAREQPHLPKITEPSAGTRPSACD